MPYTVITHDEIPHHAEKETLLDAARSASKIEDQGAVGVEILGPDGEPIARSIWEAVWRKWANSTRPSDIGL